MMAEVAEPPGAGSFGGGGLLVSVDAAWDRIDAWLKLNAKAVRKSLKSGAKPQAVKKLEAALGVTLPADFTASVARHNGQSDEEEGGLIPYTGDPAGSEPAWRLLTLDEIKATWEEMKALVDAGEFVDQTTDPAPGVRAEWWCPGWVPFGDNGGGDALCLDLSPAEGGRVGQVVLFSHEARARPLLASSFEELLSRLADELEAGKYIFDAADGLVAATDGDLGSNGSEQPISDRFVRQGQVVLLPVERPTADQLRMVQELLIHKCHANLLEVRQLMIAGGFRDFGMTMDPGLTQLITRLEQAGIPYRVEALPPVN